MLGSKVGIYSQGVNFDPGQAIVFDGVNQNVEFTGNEVGNSATKIVISQRVFRGSSGIFTSSGSQVSNISGFWPLWFNDNNIYLSFRNGNTNTAYVNNTNTGWFYLFIVYDGAKPEADRVELYIDGVKQTLIVSGTTPTSLASNAGSQLKVGSLGNSFFTDGNFGHFLIKTGVSAGLTEAQAIASGTQDPSVVIPSPEIYLPFDGNTNNLGTSGINGTANNNPTYTPEP